MYSLVLHPRAKKFLSKLSKKDARPVVDKIDLLIRDPFTPSLDIKKMATTQRSFRLRVGRIRVIYEVDTDKKRVYINDIDYRGSVY